MLYITKFTSLLITYEILFKLDKKYIIKIQKIDNDSCFLITLARLGCMI